jgi:hypothetical protein
MNDKLQEKLCKQRYDEVLKGYEYLVMILQSVNFSNSLVKCSHHSNIPKGRFRYL